MARAQRVPKKEVVRDIRKYGALEAVAKSEGGMMLISQLTREAASDITTLASRYKSLEHGAFVAHCASLSEKLAILKALRRASHNRDIAQRVLEEGLFSEEEEDD